MIVLALDPGSRESALLEYHRGPMLPGWTCRIANERVAEKLAERAELGCRLLVIEQSKAYTIPGGANARFMPEQILETCEWIGYFRRAWEQLGGTVRKLDRRAVKLFLLGRPNGTDAHVREALLDLIGPKGTKSAPGPTFGMRADLWAALAVAYVYCERERGETTDAPAARAARRAASADRSYARDTPERSGDDRAS